MTEVKANINLEKLSVKQLRQRLFVKASSKLYDQEYTFVDNAPEQIEALDRFGNNWESFSKTWDIYWAGLDPRTLTWVAGRHNSPVRKIVLPLRIVPIDERSGRMLETWEDKRDISEMEVPFKKPLPETEEDRIISNSLSGKVVVDEKDEDKAIRLIESNMVLLQEQLQILMKGK
jgi:hypothetical protein